MRQTTVRSCGCIANESTGRSVRSRLGVNIRLCGELGVDTIEAGAALAVAIDGDSLSFGDKEAAIRTLESVDTGDEMGAVIGNGCAFTGKKYGVARVPAVDLLQAFRHGTATSVGVTG